MCVVFWGREYKRFHDCLYRHLGKDSVHNSIFRESSIEELRHDLLIHRNKLNLVVMMPESVGDLRKLVDFGPLLSGLALILILPDDEIETVTLAHSLRPRYVCSATGDMENVVTVASNLLRQR